MYLGANNVKVVCERLWRFDQEFATRRWLATRLATDSRVVTCQNEAHMWSMQEDEESGQLNHYKTKSTVWLSLVIGYWNSRLIPVASDLPVHPILLKSDFSHSISYLTINTFIPMKFRELLERILREKP